MGIVLVACLAARLGWVPTGTRTSTWSWTSSARRSGSRSCLPSCQLYSMAMVSALDVAALAQALAKGFRIRSGRIADIANPGDLDARLRLGSEDRKSVV